MTLSFTPTLVKQKRRRIQLALLFGAALCPILFFNLTTPTSATTSTTWQRSELAGGTASHTTLATDPENTTEDEFKEFYDSTLEVSTDIDTSIDTDGVVYGDTVEFDNGFVHTKPGEYSEVFVVATGLPPGEKHIAYLKRAGTSEYTEQGGYEVIPDEFGVINAKFRITSYGDWEVELIGSTGVHTDIVIVK